MSQQKYKRRNYLIDKEAQFKFMAAFGLASLLSAMAAVSIFVFLAQDRLEKSLYTMRLPETTLANLLFNEMAVTTAIAVLVIILLFSYTLKKIFLRIEGPLKKLRSVIRRVKDGNLRDNVALREKDEFQAFARTLDEMKEKLRTTIKTIQLNSDYLSRIDDRETENKTTLMEECQSRLKTMKQELEQLKL
jgi:methyl-accepting chemotaxis protein